jgi:hypothetical protein
MADATLASIDAALYAALATLVATPLTTSAPFGSLIRFVGPVPGEGLPASKFPCVALRFDEETADFDVDVLADAESRSVATWSALVQVTDPQDIDRGMVGNGTGAGQTGILRLVVAVQGALNALVIEGAYRGRRIKYTGTRAEAIVRNGVYVFAVKFAARLLPPLAPTPDDSHDIDEVRADVNLEGTTDAAPNPVVQIISDTT